MSIIVVSLVAACKTLGQTLRNPACGRMMLRVDPALHAGD